jgi:exodeoxyribonuclease VII large subunit
VSLFAPMKRNLTPILRRSRLELADGMKVRIFGQLDFYAPTGRLGLKMAGIDPRFTLGELSQARDQVVQRLVAAGLFDANRGIRLSPIPLRVGVVTSVGSAAWHDFRHALERSSFGFQLAVCDTRVQGDWAASMVAASIRTLAMRGDLDCVVVIRGGGARNELATFDAESIARAIASSPIPVLTGLGHEVDRSVADEVAHTALTTPTACAGMLIEGVDRYLAASERSWTAIAGLADRQLLATSTALSERAHRIARCTHSAVERADERLTARLQQVRSVPARRLADGERQIAVASARLVRAAPRLGLAQLDGLDGRAARLALLDPVNLLQRGWSITRHADGSLVRALGELGPGTPIVTRFADGEVASTVTDVISATPPNRKADQP